MPSAPNVNLSPEAIDAMLLQQKPRISVCKWCNRYPRTILWQAKACQKCTHRIASTLEGLFPFFKEQL